MQGYIFPDGTEYFIDFSDLLFVGEIDWRVEVWDLLIGALTDEVILARMGEVSDL